jgi:hypothetical protein
MLLIHFAHKSNIITKAERRGRRGQALILLCSPSSLLGKQLLPILEKTVVDKVRNLFLDLHRMYS